MSAQEKVKVAGIVVDVEKKITRAGKKMFNLLIEDSDSAIDVVVMPQIAAKMEEEPFAIGDVLIITGKTKREGDDENATVGLILFEVEKIDDSVLIGGSPILISTNNKLSLLQIQRMNDIIEKNKGNSPVFLSFRDGNLEVKMRFNALTTKEVESTLKILAEV
jgi:DNA polymerase III alpha subunit